MMRLCWSKESNGTEYYCGCGATLITRLHALTSFNCINNKEDQESCDEISPHVAMGNEYFLKLSSDSFIDHLVPDCVID